MSYDPKYIHFVVLFNVDEDYFECHEVMEELWLEEGRNLLYQGLLQVAVGLHHWRNDNFSGAVKLFQAALDKLQGYADELLGLDLAKVRADTQYALKPLKVYLKELEEGKLTSAPEFTSFKLVVTDPGLAAEVEQLARIPLEQRLHSDEDEN